MPELYEESHENPKILNDINSSNMLKNKNEYRLQRKKKQETKKNIVSSNFNVQK
jgi:hypothetical protein